MTDNGTNPELSAELADLRARLAEAEETLSAIRGGEVDALVIAGSSGDEVRLMESGGRIYRQFIETIREGTATLSAGGEIQSCNAALAKTLRRPLDQLLGTAMRDHLPPEDQEIFSAVLAQAGPESPRRKIRLKTGEGALVPVYLSATLLHSAGAEPALCLVFTDLEEVISAEETLRESEERYRVLFENSPDAVLLTVPDGTILSANPAACRMFGRTLEELCALGRASIVDTGDPRLARLLEERERTGRVSGELTLLRRDGATFPGEISSLLFRDRLGAMRASMIIRDLTERKRAEDALQASRQLIEGIINAIPVRVFWKDRNLVYLGCNEAFARDAGFSDPQQVVGKDDFQLVWGEHADLYRDDDRRVIESGEPRLFIEEPTTTSDGKTITLLTSKLPLRNAAGEIIGVLGTYIDITERKRAEVALGESHDLLIKLTTQVPGVVYQYRLYPDGRSGFPFASSGMNDIYEMTPEEVRADATPVFGRLHPEDLDRIVASIRESARTLQPFHCEFRVVLPRQGVRWRQSDALPERMEDGGTLWHGIISDITERKEAETARARVQEEKDRLEDQLRQAQKVEAVGRLAGGVAHDFNNLTAIVLGYGEMLLGQLRPDEPARKWAEQIVAAGQRSATLTRQLLAFSRKQVLLPVVLDFNGLLRDLEKMLARLIGEDIALTFDLAEDLGRVTVDPGQLEQVVTNLVVNARDAMPRGGKLTVRTANAELDEVFVRDNPSVVPGKYVMLTVADTGCGMDKATLARLFEPFFTTKEQGKGTGLGLSTTFGIVKQSGGYLYVSSEPDKGSIFTIYLPRTSAQPKATPIETDADVPRGSGERILLVEDEASLLELCEVVLSRLGYRVSTAASGPEALLLVGEKGFEPDLVLTDVVMPGMSGAELAERLRTDRPGLKVLYMSGYPDDAIAPHGVLGPGISFLQKPFSEAVLAAKVCETLGGRKSAARPGRHVLMIDDDEQFLVLVGHFCRKRGHVFAGVDSAAAALAALAGQPFDVLLVDLNIPGTSGAAVLREIRAAGHTAPAIVLSGDIASADMDLLRLLGAVRALQKSSDAEPLLQAIEAAVTSARTTNE